MTNEEKINLIAKKILVLSSNLDKYQSELNQLKQELTLLQAQNSKTSVPTTPKSEPVIPVVEKIKVPDPELKKQEPVIINAAENKIPERVFETPQSPKAKESNFNFEEFIGAKLINIIGIAVLVIGLGIGVKYAIDRDLITPLTRIVLAYAAGGILLAIALKLKQKFKAFSAILLSGAMASLYFTTFAAYSMYELFPQLAAFAIMLLFTVFTVFAATVYSLQIIGIIGLVGAYFVPVLLSDGSGKIEVMLAYMTIINSGIVVLSFKRNWKILNHIAFALSWLIFSTWYLAKYDHEKHLLTASVFAFLFFITFYVSTMAYKIMKQEKFDAMGVIRLVSNSFIYYGIGYAALNNEQTEQYLGLFTAFNAVVHFIFSYFVFKNKLLDRKLFYLLIALVLSFITIAVPVQLEGNWVTLFWSAEAFLLFYIGRAKAVRFYEWISLAMVVFATFSLCQDIGSVYDDWNFYYGKAANWVSFFNIHFFTALFTISSFAGIIYYHIKTEAKALENNSYKGVYAFLKYGLAVLVFILTYCCINVEIATYFKVKFELSHMEVPSNVEWAEPGAKMDVYDFSWYKLKDIALSIYSMVFLIVFTFLALKKWHNVFVRWAAFSLNMIGMLMFLAVVLTELASLRDAYLNPSDNFYALNSNNLYLRYLCFLLLAVLLWLCYKLLKTDTFSNTTLHKYFTGSIIHVAIIVILCNEMVNIYMLNSVKSEMFFHNLNAVYKLGYTALYAIYSFALISFGIFKKNRIMRISAIVLFAITLFKLVTFDTWNLSTGYKVICYILLGIILLVVAFLYQKFKVLIFGDDNHKEKTNEI